LNALIGPDEANAAMKRYYRVDEIGNAALVFGVDVAGSAMPRAVIRPRRGIQCFPQKKVRNVTSRKAPAWWRACGTISSADAVFVDNWRIRRGGWIDQLHPAGQGADRHRSSPARRTTSRYYNKRAEMAFDAVQWIKDGGALTDDSGRDHRGGLRHHLHVQGDRLLLEPKNVEAQGRLT
jgi:phage terminase large subunit